MTTLKDVNRWLVTWGIDPAYVQPIQIGDETIGQSLHAFLLTQLKQFAEEVRVTGGIEVAHGRATKKETELINNGWQSCQAVQAAKVEAAIARREG